MRDETPVLAVRLEGLRILIVEDNPDALDLLQISLEIHGALVVAVPSVAAAVDALEASRPDIVLSDITMPGEDGFDLMAKLRRLDDPPPAVAVTALGAPEDRERILAAGFRAHLSKPVEVSDLIVVIAGLTGRL